MTSPFISPDKIEEIVQLEPVLVLFGSSLISFLFYKVALRGVSGERHRLLIKNFKGLLIHASFLLFFFGLTHLASESKAYPYLGFITIVLGAIVLVRIARIFIFEYLFLSNMKAGVPALISNICSLALSLGLASWIATEVFGIRLVPVLATSALISVVLGLAIQDTLGNLFAGVALHFDKSYDLGDWIEIQNGTQKQAGQVLEITWRSTVLLGILDEVITLPNRVVAQSQIATWGGHGKPFWRGLSYRVPFAQSIDEVRATLSQTVVRVSGVLSKPAPCIYLNEIGDSWLNFRVVFCIENYGAQYAINDRVNTAVMEAFLQKNIAVAIPAMRVEMSGDRKTS